MGLEYSYSVNERIRLAGLMGDGMLQAPMLCDCTSAWKCREATDEMQNAGPAEERGVWWEATTAMAALLSGADILVIRHPKAAVIVREAISGLRGE
jgi:acetyl-CoA decarbonylase/synthase complex subunit delta